MKTAGHQREFTGFHLLLIMVAFFGVVVAVNITLAVFANRTWTGLVVPNTYVASQEFNERTERGRHQLSLGWQPVLRFENGRLSYGLTDKSGSVIPLDRVQVLLHRPVSGLQDTVLVLERQPDGSYATDVALGDGAWIIEVEAEAGLEFPYRDVRRIHIREGVLR